MLVKPVVKMVGWKDGAIKRACCDNEKADTDAFQRQIDRPNPVEHSRLLPFTAVPYPFILLKLILTFSSQ